MKMNLKVIKVPFPTIGFLQDFVACFLLKHVSKSKYCIFCKIHSRSHKAFHLDHCAVGILASISTYLESYYFIETLTFLSDLNLFINAKDFFSSEHQMQLCIQKPFYTSQEAEVIIKHTLVGSTKTTVAVIAVCNKM